MNDLSKPAVWIVDDDEDDQLLIRFAFNEVNPSVDLVILADGEELLPKLAQSATLPKLILLDINMPRRNGFDILKELRQVRAFSTLPVVILTTSSAQKEFQHSLELGANHFLTKPLTYDRLKDMVKLLTYQWELI